MAEAILVKGSSGMNEKLIEDIAVNAVISQQPGTALITENMAFECPKDGYYTVTCIGGGGGYGAPNFSRTSMAYQGGYGGGGGSGWFNTNTFQFNRGDIINITIGLGGGGGQAGGTTFFGNYSSANGGSSGGAANYTGGYPGWSGGYGGAGYRSGNAGYWLLWSPGSDKYLPDPPQNGCLGGIGFKSPINLDDGWIYGYGGNAGRGAWGGGAVNGGNGCVYISWS